MNIFPSLEIPNTTAAHKSNFNEVKTRVRGNIPSCMFKVIVV